MDDKDRNRLIDMLSASQRAIAFVDGKSREELEANQELLAFAVVRAIEIVGEAASKISIETRSDFEDIEWHNIIGMRNRIVHDYLNVDYDIIWAVINKNLPKLIEQLENILDD